MTTATIAAPKSASSTHDIALAAKHASRLLAPLDEAARNAALEAMAKALESASAELLAANSKDMHAAETAGGEDKLPVATQARLKLSPAKLREMVKQVRSVAALADPLGRVLDAVELDDQDPAGSRAAKHGLHMQRISVPLGVLAVIFEARPDAVTQIAALALKSGNAVILKPGSEVERYRNGARARCCANRWLSAGLPQDAISLVKGRKRIAGVARRMHDLIDMIIPRGSKASSWSTCRQTPAFPSWATAEGICHIYVDRNFDDQELALRCNR
jgi:glutamate-5-semialdehyde dehydrogenase